MTTKNDYASPDTAEPSFGRSLLSHLWASVASTVILTIICCGLYPLIIWGVAKAVFPYKADGSLVKKDGSPTTNPAEAVGSSLIGQPFTQPIYFHPRPSAAGNSAGSSFSPTGGYDPTGSTGTNYGPLSDMLINGQTTSPTAPATQPAEFLAYDGVRLRTIHYMDENKIKFSLYMVSPDGAKKQVPLSDYKDDKGTLLDLKLVDAFPHPNVDGDDKRTVLIAGDFGRAIPADAVTASGSGLDPHISPENAEIQKDRVAEARKIKAEQVEELIKANTDGPGLGIFGDPGVNVLMLNLALDAKYPAPAK
jgi:K+-transporting ATPase ATPase C chain